MKLSHSFFSPFLLFLFGVVAFSLFFSKALFATQNNQNLNFFEKYKAEAYYLDLSEIGNAVIKNKIIGRPPAKGSPEELADKQSSEEIYNNLTPEEKMNILQASNSVFSFNTVLGSNFNFTNLVKTAAFFQKVDNDISIAEEAAKQTFQYPRPVHNFGYSYPSGYAARAYVDAILLGTVFPNCKAALYAQARQQGESRIMIRKQYPSAVAAGELYGKYLVAQFLKNPSFVQDWQAVQEEMLSAIPAETMPVADSSVTSTQESSSK